MVPTEDKKYENDNPHVQEQVKAAKAEAKRRTAESKDKDYYVRVDGKNKKVTLESSPKTKNLLYHVFNDVIKGPIRGAGNLIEAEKLTWTGHPIKGVQKRLEGIGNIFGASTLGLGSFLGDFADRYTPGEVQYGTKQEVNQRQKTENLLVSMPIDMIVSAATSKISIGKISSIKPKNPVTRMTAAESRIAKQGATVLEEGTDGVFQIPENAVTSSKNVSKNLTNNTTEVINYTESVERIAQTAGNAAKNLKTPAIEYKNVPQLYGDASLGLDKTKTIVDENGFLTKPVYGGKTVIGAGERPQKGAYNIDIKPDSKGVIYGDANNLNNIASNSQSKVIIENPFGFYPLNEEIQRITADNGLVKITGTQTNKYLKYYFTKSWNNTRNIPECFLVCNFGVKQGQQGLTTKGEQIKTNNIRYLELIKNKTK